MQPKWKRGDLVRTTARLMFGRTVIPKGNFREEVESILSHMDDYTEVELLRQLSEVDDGDWFSDFCEVRNNEYTVRYQWACHAIPWAIAQYDKQKGGEA